MGTESLTNACWCPRGPSGRGQLKVILRPSERQLNVCAERCRHHRRRDAFGDRAAVQAVRPGHAEDAQPHHHHRRHQDHLAASAAHALAGCSRAARPSPLLARAAAGAPRAQREAAPQRQPRGREGRPAAALRALRLADKTKSLSPWAVQHPRSRLPGAQRAGAGYSTLPPKRRL